MGILDYVRGGKYGDIEIWSLRAGGGIRISKDKVQRRTKNDGAQYYYIKGTKDELEPQEFKHIFVGSKGEEVLKVFSPTKGVYLPIKFIYKRVRPFNEKEQEYINEATSDDEKKKRAKETYQKIYKISFESQVDSDSLNHAIYKIQKNALRLQGGGMDLSTKIALMMVMMIVVFIIISWATYNYFIKPGMDFWSANAKDVLTAKELDLETARLNAGITEPLPQTPTPVGG